MTDPVRLRVLKALTATIQTVTPSNGYTDDLSASVFRGRFIYGEDDPLPMISILEEPRQEPSDKSPRPSPMTMGWWVLLIQGFVKDDKANPTDPAHLLMAQVKKAIAAEIVKFRGGAAFGIPEIDGINIEGGVVRPPDQLSPKAYFYFPLHIRLTEDNSDPYS